MRDKSVWSLLLPAAALLFAALACARADVPLEQAGAIGSGGLSTPSRLPGTAQDPTDAVITPSPSPPAVTATPTPDRPQPLVSPTFPPTATPLATQSSESLLYTTQPGDTLRALAVRFSVLPEEMRSADGTPLPVQGLIDPDLLLIIPRRLAVTGPAERLIPDSEFVFSPHAVDFSVAAFVEKRGGFLGEYQEYIGGRWRSGAEVVYMAARDNAVNPRLLLALLEYESGWVTDPRRPRGDDLNYPFGHMNERDKGLYRQLSWAANEMGNGYYGWRAGMVTELTFGDGSVVRLAPDLNAGTVALQYYFAQRLGPREWAEALGPEGFIAIYHDFFGDPWEYFHPLFEPGVTQPSMILPFLPGRVWSLTGGPHGAWEREAAWAALDLAPSTSVSGCEVSEDWAVAAAPGLVLRSGGGVVVLDLDGDGREQTGWVLIYLHVAEKGSVKAGEFVEQGDLIGHPSCEGGIATGSHIHLVRKYNGEWVLADGPLPFNLSGWVAKAGSRPYQGALVQGDQQVLACPCASSETLISR